MKVLILEGQAALASVWAACLRRLGAEVTVVDSQQDAIAFLQRGFVDILIVNLALAKGSALAVADFVSYRHPDTKIIPVTSSSFFADGSVFQHIPNACTSLGSGTPPEDLAAIVQHYAQSA